MARDKLIEIEAVRERGQPGPARGKSAIEQVRRQWDNGKGAAPATFVVIRLVTALEVSTRDWVREIVDAGEPYITRAAALVKGGIKFDFAIAQALVGKKVTFGDLIAHDISLNRISDIDAALSKLIDAQLFESLNSMIHPDNSQSRKGSASPIISDTSWTRRQLGELFERRHVLVHELPDNPDIEAQTIANFICAASNFWDAVDQAISTLLYGDYPHTQLEMNAKAADKAAEATAELRVILGKLQVHGPDDILQASQDSWELYVIRQAEYRSGINTPYRGSVAPMLYASEVERITRLRIEELERQITRKEGDL